MALIKFVANHDYLSTDRGYQFKFYCDKCRNGYLSAFQSSISGMAGGLLRAAGNLFGGVLGRVGNSTYEIQRAIAGKAHDDALMKAVEEGKQHIKQCSRCGKWVCPEVCWNQARGLCEGCAPDEVETLAAAQAQTTSEQILQKARETNLIQHLDMNQKATAEVSLCPNCGAKTTGSKFCPECGGSLVTTIQCKNCGAKSAPSTLFCPDCGNRIAL
jgi:ribosomal protein L32